MGKEEHHWSVQGARFYQQNFLKNTHFQRLQFFNMMKTSDTQYASNKAGYKF